MKPSRLPTLVQRFFTERLTEQVNASPNTIAGYRDTFRLLLTFASSQRGRPPTNDQGRHPPSLYVTTGSNAAARLKASRFRRLLTPRHLAYTKPPGP
ncbi:hypothetical protein BN77_p40002 [Rhizobium mesoamericanum STM3625]|uniref:Uncharacterized protein n=1 Tax=Rhizobium mesoamericanum STM3625 TaxID=1211777 RepID=K0Q6E3_9HYPH|nr:hypothetical protein BN77_p40002 [Rhizobium mesoamericanum STM3625]